MPILGLKNNPFRMTPSNNSNEIEWAGFPELKKQLEKRLQMSMRISNSSLILNWGEYGSGKTHAANYFIQENTLKRLSEESNKKTPFTIKMTLPKGKNPLGDLFTRVIDFLDLDELRIEFEDILEGIEESIDASVSNKLIANVLKHIFRKDIDSQKMKSYLYDTISNADLKDFKDNDIQRKIKIDGDDSVELLGGLFSCLTFKQEKYSSVVLWIDEFEDIKTMNNSNVDKTNNFIREIMDNTPNNFLVFINFTMSTFEGGEDLQTYLSPAVVSRVKSRIEFKMPSNKEFKEYLKDLLGKYRITAPENGSEYFPFEESAVDYIINKLGVVSLRKYNEAFSLLLELAEFDEKDKVSKDFVVEYEKEWEGWKI